MVLSLRYQLTRSTQAQSTRYKKLRVNLPVLTLEDPKSNGYLNLKLSILQICLREKEKNKSWYLDSGCSRHMTGEKSMFLTLAMKEGGNVKFGG